MQPLPYHIAASHNRFMTDMTPRKKKEIAALYGAAVARLRERKRMTQPQFAERLGVVQSTVSFLETGRNQTLLKPAYRRQVVEALGVSEEELEAEYARGGDAEAAPQQTTPTFTFAGPGAGMQWLNERTVFTEEGRGNSVRVVLNGEMTGDLLDALEQFVTRTRRRMQDA